MMRMQKDDWNCYKHAELQTKHMMYINCTSQTIFWVWIFIIDNIKAILCKKIEIWGSKSNLQNEVSQNQNVQVNFEMSVSLLSIQCFLLWLEHLQCKFRFKKVKSETNLNKKELSAFVCRAILGKLLSSQHEWRSIVDVWEMNRVVFTSA